MRKINVKGINIKLAIDNYNIKKRQYQLIKDSEKWLYMTGFIGFMLDPILLSNNIDVLSNLNEPILEINRTLIYTLVGIAGILKAYIKYDFIGLKSINKLEKVKKYLEKEGINASIEDLINGYCTTYKFITKNATENKIKTENAIGLSLANKESCIVQEVDFNNHDKINKTYLINYYNK